MNVLSVLTTTQIRSEVIHLNVVELICPGLLVTNFCKMSVSPINKLTTHKENPNL